MHRSRSEAQYMQPQYMSSRVGRTVANIVIGTLVGAVSALLFAPASGRQVRKEIAKTASDLGDQAVKITANATKAAKKSADKVHMPDLSKVQMPDFRKVHVTTKQDSGVGKWVAGIAIGALIGAGVALLYAPKTGQQMRQQLKREADDLAGRASTLARETADEARNRARDLANEAEGDLRRQKEIMEDVNNRDYPL